MQEVLSTVQELNRRDLQAVRRSGRWLPGFYRKSWGLEKKDNFIATRKGILDPDTLTREERAELIQREPAYGNIICRCEMITEGEILDAIPPPAGRTVSGRVGRVNGERGREMGRCQSGFCSPRTMEILARELHVSMADITKSGGKSQTCCRH